MRCGTFAVFNIHEICCQYQRNNKWYYFSVHATIKVMLTDTQIQKVQRSVEPTQDELLLCEAFRLLGDWNRYRIVRALLVAGELCVSEIARIVDISMSATSQHLRLLELSGLVAGERMGQTICYKLNQRHPRVKALIKLIS